MGGVGEVGGEPGWDFRSLVSGPSSRGAMLALCRSSSGPFRTDRTAIRLIGGSPHSLVLLVMSCTPFGAGNRLGCPEVL